MNDNTQHPPPELEHVPAAWASRYRRIHHIAERLGRLPRRSDNGIDAADVSWIADQRRSTTLGLRQRRLLALLPGWSEGTRDGAWYERAEALRAFIARQQRMPRVRSDDAVERALAYWCSRQQVAARRGLLDPERVAALEYALRDLPSQ